jgi:hypothetical protein
MPQTSMENWLGLKFSLGEPANSLRGNRLGPSMKGFAIIAVAINGNRTSLDDWVVNVRDFPAAHTPDFASIFEAAFRRYWRRLSGRRLR